MIYQVLVNFNDSKNKPLEVADSLEEFNKTTIRELKEKFREKIPGAPGGSLEIKNKRNYLFINSICECRPTNDFHIRVSTCHLRCSSYVINVCLLSDLDLLRVIFGRDPLEDHQTLEFYNIKHLSLLLFLMRMPGGGGGTGMIYAFTC